MSISTDRLLFTLYAFVEMISSLMPVGEQLRFYNRTCGLRAGPYLTELGTADNWAIWNVTIRGRDERGQALISIQAAYPYNNEKCSGYVATRYGSVCTDAKAKRATMSSRRIEEWRLAPVGGDSYRIIVDSRDGGCNRFLSASGSCDVKYSRILTSDSGPRSRWTFHAVDLRPEETQPPDRDPVAYVTDVASNIVSVCYDADLTDCVRRQGPFHTPYGVAVSNAGLVLVANYNDSIPSVTVCDRDLTTCNKAYGKPFVKPTGIAVVGTTVYITNHPTNTVDVCFISEGTLVNCGRRTNNFASPYGVTVRDGSVYIANFGDSTISVCDVSLSLCQKFSDVDNIDMPTSIAFDGATAYITNYRGGDVARCIFAPEFSCEKIANTIFDIPFDMAIKNSRYYVVNKNGPMGVSVCVDSNLITCRPTSAQTLQPAGIEVLRTA